MSTLPKVDMMEVTRLTREGRLHEAMAVLHGALPGAAPSNVEAMHRQNGAALASILDMVPPSPATGGAWTAQPFPAAQSPIEGPWPSRRSQRRCAAS